MCTRFPVMHKPVFIEQLDNLLRIFTNKKQKNVLIANNVINQPTNRKNSAGPYRLMRWCKTKLINLTESWPIRLFAITAPQLTMTNIPEAKTGQKQQKGESERNRRCN